MYVKKGGQNETERSLSGFIAHFVCDLRGCRTAFFEIINGNRKAQGGDYKWGVTITTAYLPLDNTRFFESDLNLVDWLSQFGEGNEVYFKSFLGRMLFSGICG